MPAARLVRGTQATDVRYPDSDGQPMAENTLQFQWIVTLKENLDALIPDFVAGDLLWYPVEGDNKTRLAPDVMVALGRPKGYRGSYRQWVEGGVPPAVVFEVLSPGNTFPEMYRKLQFYETYGVSEYYVYDPDNVVLTGWIRQGSKLVEISAIDGWVSPLLKIRFQLGDELEVYHPNGERFLTFAERIALSDEAVRQAADAARQAADAQKAAADAQKAAADAQRQATDAQKQVADAQKQAADAAARADALAAKLRALGIDPDAA